MLKTKNHLFLGLCAILGAAAPLACGSSSPSAVHIQANLSGKVTDVSGQALAGAKLESTGGASVISDAQGAYAFATTADQLGGITISLNNHATIYRSLAADAEVADFKLRPVDLVSQFALPSGSAAAVDFSVPGNGTSLKLSVRPDSLVDPSGTLATGNANIKITFWDPNSTMDAIPASLTAHSPYAEDNDIINTQISTFGMFDIIIEQNGLPLQIAPNSNMPISQALTPILTDNVAQAANFSSATFLWYLDPNTQSWRLAADTVLEPSTNTLKGALPHLSSWNFDNFSNNVPPRGCTFNQISANPTNCKPVTTDLGGCVQGTIRDAAGKLVVGKGTLWLFSQEGIYDVTVNTDKNGHFCYNAGIRAINRNATGFVSSNSLPNHVSAFRSSDNSSLKNPIPGGCKNMDPGQANWNQYPTNNFAQWNGCGLVENDFNDQQANHKPVFTPNKTTVNLCAYCPGTGPSNCPISGYAVTNKCGTAGTPDGADACAKQLNLGDSCTPQTAMCCPKGSLCADGQCVPEKDIK